ncbi:MAG: bifunctional proline dehydrogenase/L-glutamate gamma-semialdehyde dehydrogenase PutA, partial [Hoeflea sp.]
MTDTNRSDDLTAFHAPHVQDDDRLARKFGQQLRFTSAQNQSIDDRATKLIKAIRSDSGQRGRVDDFLREYGLSTREGLALMVLAEALLRVPDALTQDRLIEDKLKEGGWSDHESHGDTWFVSASAWALGMSARVIKPGETPEGVMRGLVKRMGMPTVRTATRQAMRFLGHHFVLGETIGEALERAAKNETRGYRHSFDMLGEGARTRADAKRYFKSYADAIAAIGKSADKISAGRKLPDRPGISVKLSALHPRYVPTHRDEVLEDLVPDVVRLAQMAKAHDLNFTIDAEEVDRLELSLDVIDRAFADPSLAGWDGFGLAIQAYQKRAPQVIDHIAGLCGKHGRRMMVRLVKGAYWDTEIKRAQERGLEGYAVFTRKAATDLSYLACAQQMLDLRDVIFPQFATHNALTVATIIEMAQDRSGFEFQRLHGMGDAVYNSLSKSNDRVPCRIYAPVGGYRDLLAYLVRRLLENGANSSFVAVAGDKNVPIADLLTRPDAKLGLAAGQSARNSQIPLPLKIYPDRTNSRGSEVGDRLELESLSAGMARSTARVEAGPLAPGLKGGRAQDIASPSDPTNVVGTVRFTDPKDVDKAVESGLKGFRSWSRTDPVRRAEALDKAASMLEERRDRFMALLSAEAGKTLDDGSAEIRDAVEVLRYYAARSREMVGARKQLPGPTG